MAQASAIVPTFATPGYAATAFAGSTQAAPLEYAGYGIRFLARFVDMIVIYTLAALSGFVLGFISVFTAVASGRPAEPAEALASVNIFAFVLSLLAALLFHAVAEGIHGSTPGKMLVGLTVLSDTQGPCGFGSALGREAAYFVDGLFFGLVAYGSMKQSQRRQRLGDKWAHTIVVYRKSLPPSQRRSSARFLVACVAACSCYGVLSLLGLMAGM
jgi:uncharacterized RDD family membrane protein YckC